MLYNKRGEFASLVVIALVLVVFAVGSVSMQDSLTEKSENKITGLAYGGNHYFNVISINNAFGSSLTDYQVKITLDTASLISAGKMKSDCGDIRVLDSDGTTIIPHWIELNPSWEGGSTCNTLSTVIWVKVPLIPTGSKIIYVSYGDPSAISTSNAEATFEFYDGFDSGNLDTSKWSTYYRWATYYSTFPLSIGSATVENNYLKLYSGSESDSGYSIYTFGKKNFGIGYALDYVIRPYNLGALISSGFLHDGSTIPPSKEYLNFFGLDNNYYFRYATWMVGLIRRANKGDSTLSSTSFVPLNGSSTYKESLRWTPRYIAHFSNDNQIAFASVQSYDRQLGGIFFNAGGGPIASTTFYIDNIRVRKFVFPEPTIIVQFCGNNIVEPGEQCDDGNQVYTDSCKNDCTLPACGDGIVSQGEQCDDGNTADGDGCSATCQTEVLNKPPILKTQIPNQNTNQGEITTINLDDYFSDPDNDPLTYTKTQTGANTEITITNNIASIKGLTRGADSVVFKADDGKGGTINSNSVSINVNVAPQKIKDIPNQEVKEQQTITLNMNDYFSDPGDTLTFSVSPQPLNSIITFSGTTASIKGNKIGKDTTTFIATDPKGLSISSNSVEINVKDATPPTISNIVSAPTDNSNYAKNQNYVFKAQVSDNIAVDKVLFEHNFGGTLVNVTPQLLQNEYVFSIADLAAGSYKTKWYANDTANNRAETTQQTYTIKKSPSSVTVLINRTVDGRGTTDDVFVAVKSIVNLTGIIAQGEGDIELIQNKTVLQSGPSPLYVVESRDVLGLFNITARHQETQNFTSSQDTSMLEVVSNLPPSSIITFPKDNQGFGKSSLPINVQGIAGDDVGLASVKLKISDVGEFAVTGTTSWSYSFNPASASTYNLQSFATNVLGYEQKELKNITVFISFDSEINNSIIINSTVANSNITNSTINSSILINSVINLSKIINSTIYDSYVENNTIKLSSVNESSIYYSAAIISTIVNSTIIESKITNSSINESAVIKSTVTDSYVYNNKINKSTVEKSSIKDSTLDNSIIKNSTIINSNVVNLTLSGVVVENNLIKEGTIDINNIKFLQGTKLDDLLTYSKATIDLINLKHNFTGTDITSNKLYFSNSVLWVRVPAPLILKNEFAQIYTNRIIDIPVTRNIGSNVVLAKNQITINEVNLPELDAPAELTLYKVDFGNPEILINGKRCHKDECRIKSNENETLVFDVSGFSTYSARENVPENETKEKEEEVELIVELRSGEEKDAKVERGQYISFVFLPETTKYKTQLLGLTMGITEKYATLFLFSTKKKEIISLEQPIQLDLTGDEIPDLEISYLKSVSLTSDEFRFRSLAGISFVPETIEAKEVKMETPPVKAPPPETPPEFAEVPEVEIPLPPEIPWWKSSWFVNSIMATIIILFMTGSAGGYYYFHRHAQLEELANYILASKLKGYSTTQITNTLMTAGWAEKEVEKAFEYLLRKKKHNR
ncbi:MAG: DUF2341 domain-containing protein [Candidatus Woesearchaeota archaeon]